MSEVSFPAGFFDRADPSPDKEFYALPRLVQHIDPETVAALGCLYREVLAPGSRLLDLMSSWVSHLPEDVRYAHVAGLGMSGPELARNPRLDEQVVHDLNADPELPFADARFDAVLCAVSVQYLIRPLEVFASVARVLAPGGLFLVAVSHRVFPTKAIRGWQMLPPERRPDLVRAYFAGSGGFGPAGVADRSPARADPLWIVSARRRD